MPSAIYCGSLLFMNLLFQGQAAMLAWSFDPPIKVCKLTSKLYDCK